MCNQKYLIFFLRKLLSVSSSQKLDFWKSLFIYLFIYCKNSDLLILTGDLDTKFKLLKINKNLFSHVTIFFLYNQEIWKRRYFKVKNTFEPSNKCFVNMTLLIPYNETNHASNLPLQVSLHWEKIVKYTTKLLQNILWFSKY